MKIIMLAGGSNTGKSYTLTKKFIPWLKEQKAKEIEPVKRSGRDSECVFCYNNKNIAVL